MGHYSHRRLRLSSVGRYMVNQVIINMLIVLRFGYDQGVMSGLLTGQAFIAQFPEIDTTATGNGSSSLQGTVLVTSAHHRASPADASN